VLAANAPKLAGAVPPEAEVLLDELNRLRHAGRGCDAPGALVQAGAAMPGLMFRPNLTARRRGTRARAACFTGLSMASASL